VASNDWTAIHNHQPPGPKKLIVRGTVMVSSSKATADLKPAQPQGINEKDYLLEVIEHPSGEPDNPVMTPFEVEYEEVTDVEYDTVSIRPDGPTGIKVEHPE
jgi:hypothetical protein